jgi:hypothetical protein
VRPEQVPPGPLLVDTDVVSLLALNEDRSDEFEALIRGHELFVCFVTVAEVETLLRLNVLDANRQAALATALSGYSRFEVDIDTVVERLGRSPGRDPVNYQSERSGAAPERHLARRLCDGRDRPTCDRDRRSV